MSNIVPFAEMTKMAAVVANSRMFGFKTQDEALAIMLLCQGEGLHPAVAMRDYHVISGRPSMKADAMLARFQTAGGSVKWTRYDETAVSGVFAHPLGGSVEITWNMEQAKRANLSGKEVWKSHPRAMLRARCISEGIRTVFPACIVGVYTPEEIQAMPALEPVAVQSHVVEKPVAPPAPPADAPLLLIGPNAKEYSFKGVETWLEAAKRAIAKVEPNALGAWRDANKAHIESVAERFPDVAVVETIFAAIDEQRANVMEHADPLEEK